MDDFQPHALEEDSSDHVSDEEENLTRMKRSSLLHVAPSKGKRCKESGFHKSSRLCLHAIRDAVLHHRWQEAAQYLDSYTQTLEDTTTSRQLLAPEIIWRIGIEVLQHHPNKQQELFTILYERIKNTGVKNYAKVCLEHAFHLLLQGGLQNSKQQLSVAMSWRYGKQCDHQCVELTLIRAYCGFLYYLIWTEKRTSMSDADCGTNQDLHSYFRHASVSLQEVIKQPGVWDPFVCACVDMLEFYNSEEKAVELLQNYAYNKDFPSNPNAHVYLYTHQKRRNASPDQLCQTLKGLHSLVPSHELMLEYCHLLMKSEEGEGLRHALSVAMNLLEHAGWKTNVKAWTCLLTVLKCIKNKKLNTLIIEEMEGRREYWVKMHFKVFHYRRDSKVSADIVQLKSTASKLLGVYSKHYRMVSCTEKTKLIQKKTKAQRRKT